MAAPQASSRLEMLQARFQQRQLLEKEQKLLQLYDQQQLRAHQVAQRGSAGSNGSNSSGNGTSSTVSHHQTVTRTTTNTHSTANSQPGGKVRQMFDERRQTTVKGIDKSYPLEPLDNRSRKQQTTTSTTTTSNVVASTASPPKNGNPMSNRQSLVVRRTVRSEANSNVNGGKPIVSYREEVTRELCGPTERDNEHEEFGDDDENHEYRYGNGNRHSDQHSEVQIEDITNENTTQRHRTTATIHLSEFDGDNEANRFNDNMGNEQFSENIATYVPDRLPRRTSSTKKPVQAEARLERFKNANTKRLPNTNKQVAGNTTSYTKKRTETTVNSGSTARASEATMMTEEERWTRARSPTPDVEATGRPRSSTPEERSRKLTSPVVDRRSIVTKSSGISKVSQLTHKDSMDFYPRRKSEFEKSKTFRKLQLELGESSPEPAEPEEESTTLYGKQCRKRSSILDKNIYKPGHRSSSSSPTANRDASEGRRSSREKSSEHSQPPKSSGSPVSGRRPSDSKEELKTSSFQSHTYSSRRRSSSVSPNTDRDASEGRRSSREKSPEHSQPPKSSGSPVSGRRPSDSKEELKTSSFQSHTYSSRRRSSSVSPNTDRDASEGRRSSREKSPEHSQPPRSSESPVSGRRPSDSKEELKTSSFQSHTYSSRRRSSSASPSTDRDVFEGRRSSREKSPEHLQPPRSSGSPVSERRPSDSKKELKTSNFQSHTYSSVSPNTDRDASEERRSSREKSPEHLQPPRSSGSPVCGRRPSDSKEEVKTSSTQSHTYSSRRDSSSSSYTADRDTFKGRRTSREMSPKQSRSRKGSESPIYETTSTIKTQNTKKLGEGHHSTRVETNFYSSGRRSSSTRPTVDSCASKGSRVVREQSPERPQSRRGSTSPVRERKSGVRNEEIANMRSEVRKTDHETNIYSSRRRSSSSSPITPRDPDVERRSSREMSPERPRSRRGSESPVYRRRSPVTIEETEHTRAEIETSNLEKRSTSPICRRMTSGRPKSPHEDFRRSSTERREVTKVDIDSRRTSGETLRSFELVKKLARPASPDRHKTTSTRQSSERKSALEEVEVRRSESRRRSESPTHRVVKKDKAVMEISKEEKSKITNNNRKNSNEPRERNVRSRSRTTSPSSPTSSSMRETASFRAKKAERKNSSETKKIESKRNQHEEKKVHDLSHEKARNCDLTSVNRSPSPVDDEKNQSRKSSTEITVKRRETFKIGKPIARIIQIERESCVDDDDELPIAKTGVTDTRDKSELFDRIEKIRTTLSKSGRSEHDSQQSKDFERTDSVESALKRFDSIGAETEHHVTVGVDEIDRSSRSQSPELIVRSTKEMSSPRVTKKKSVELRNKPTRVTVAVVKAQPRKINQKSRDVPKEKVSRVGHNISEATKSVKEKKEKSIALTTPRQPTKTRSSQKITTCLLRNSKLRGEESSGRGERKAFESSPECKRRLFEDSESEIDTDNSRSTVVMSTITTAAKRSGLDDIETRNNRGSLKIGNENMIRSESNLRDARSDYEQPTKILRSIEDIRQSIKRESQDFKRELSKFNTAMRKDEESSSLVDPDESVTSGIISCVKITKTLNPGDVEPVINIERSTIKLPITHRVAKSPSPDIGGKRSTNGRARTPTGSVRRSVASSPAKTPDATSRYGSADSKGSGKKTLTRTTPSSSATREDRMRLELSRTTEYTDCTDGSPNNSEFTVIESASSTTTKANDGFVVEFDDDEVASQNNEIASSSPTKPLLRKQSTEKSLTSQKQTKSPSTTPLPRPASALSTSSTGSARGQTPQINLKSKMSTKTKISSSSPQKAPPTNARASTAVPANDGLAPCKICGRRFNSDRVTLHEQICSKTATKKRKQFDATIHRVKGTELEPFVAKKGGAKKAQTDRKTSKPEVKSNWRRKHEDFINAIRSAKQVQAHLAAGGKLSDLPPPPASDTSDYIQCPHCGRKFNQGAAERHIPKCQNMMHNKPNPRAPPKPKR